MELNNKQKLLLQFVKDSHGEQKRKYTNKPYWTHLYSVAEIVHNRHPHLIEVALCHDLLEDTKVEIHELLKNLLLIGYSLKKSFFIIECVNDLTDIYTKCNYPNLNRKKRKKLESNRLSKINSYSQTVKYADIIHNSKSIIEYDKGFAKVYLSEKRQILKLMNKGDSILFKRCNRITNIS